jgi:hypothetical protein
MEQRRLRLGDILDDYCPRERRVTNHAVVAMIEDEIKQTRCTTCDAEHAYKGGRAPRRRKAEGTATLYKEVLAGLSDADASVPDDPGPSEMSSNSIPSDEPFDPVDPVDADADADAAPDVEDASVAPPPADEGPVHRPLIRATLPRPEGVKVERPIPEFTIRQNGGRGGNFRDARGGKGRGPGGGNRPGHGGGGGGRFGRHGRGSGMGRHKKRSR